MKLGTMLTGALLMAGMFTANAAPVAYDGAVFDFSIAPVSGSTYSLTYTADFSDFLNSSGKQDSVAAINWKIAGADLQSAKLVDTNAQGNWSAPLFDSNLNANGCNTKGGGQGFLCLEASNWLTQTTEGSLYWTFDVTFDKALTDAQLTNEGNPIRALFAYADENGDAKQAGNMSCVTGNVDGKCGYVNIPVVLDPQDPPANVPEPGIAGLLGLGALGLLVGRRRRAPSC